MSADFIDVALVVEFAPKHGTITRVAQGQAVSSESDPPRDITAGEESIIVRGAIRQQQSSP